MNPLLINGTILLCGFVMGEIATMIKLPKVTGYILGGILLNPGILHVIPAEFVQNSDMVTNMALAFITFSVGGTLARKKIAALGKSISMITIFEAECALLAVIFGFILVFHFFGHGLLPASVLGLAVPLAILMGTLASPTDPSATLAVTHEYKARGEVSGTIMGVAAFDDIFGILNFSLGIAVARLFLPAAHHAFNVKSSVLAPLAAIAGGIGIGIVYGLAMNVITRLTRREGDGTIIVIVLALLALCFGTAKHFHADELLSTMTCGIVVINLNPLRKKIFSVLERYTEELIFILFFTLSGMHLDLSVIAAVYPLILLFILLRALGKFGGTRLGAGLAQSPAVVKKYTAFGLLPQGGIVIGLALMIQSYKDFAPFASILTATIIGATVVHEIMGPVMARVALKKAGEIH